MVNIQKHIQDYSCREQAVTKMEFKVAVLTVVNWVYLVQERDWWQRLEESQIIVVLHKMWRVPWLAGRPLASEAGLLSMELFIVELLVANLAAPSGRTA